MILLWLGVRTEMAEFAATCTGGVVYTRVSVLVMPGTAFANMSPDVLLSCGEVAGPDVADDPEDAPLVVVVAMVVLVVVVGRGPPPDPALAVEKSNMTYAVTRLILELAAM
jgi:hypothetical protein